MYLMQTSPAEITMEKMYSANSGLNKERNMSSPKKGTMFHSVFNALNILWEQFSKVPASFIASINYPLSVTIVNNGGIISQDFFKNLTTKRESLDIDNVYTHDAQLKESLNIVQSIHNQYISRFCNEDMKDNLNFNYEYIDNKNKDIKRSDEKESVDQENFKCITSNCNYLVPMGNSHKVNEERIFKYICPDINTQKRSTGKNSYNIENIYSKSTSNNEELSNCINSMDDKMIMNIETTFSTPTTKTLSIQTVQQATVSNLFTNMLHRVFGGVTDRFCKTDDTVDSDMTMKRSFSPKQRRRCNAVAKSRGRGRGKSQLRRSGVSQTRHRKERTKHDITVDIENDLKSWEEFNLYDTIESKESEDCFILDEDTVDAVQYIIEETMNPVTCTFADIKPKIQKSKTRKNVDKGMSKFPMKMRSIPECTEETNIFLDLDFVENRYNLQKNTFRPRLISESSIDSEDSYCIVFETGSEVASKSDLEDSEESDIDQTSEDEESCKDEGSVSSDQKVKFNLKPVVHIMVQWDFAYRAARKGPWEQMGRDRERFRGRINCIERVLNPILTVQHRTHIWQERFAFSE